MNLRRSLISGFALTALAALSVSAKPNLSGEWKMNASKSDFGEWPAPASWTQKTTHEDPSLKVASKMATDQGEMEFDTTYSTDGKETTNSFGPGTFKSTAKWEGDKLMIQTKGQFGDNEITFSDRWEISEDGKVVTIYRQVTSAMGELKQKIVMEKQ